MERVTMDTLNRVGLMFRAHALDAIVLLAITTGAGAQAQLPTSFRGIFFGMSKEDVLRLSIEDFAVKFEKYFAYGGGSYAAIERKDRDGLRCGEISYAFNEVMFKISLLKCFFSLNAMS